MVGKPSIAALGGLSALWAGLAGVAEVAAAPLPSATATQNDLAGKLVSFDYGAAGAAQTHQDGRLFQVDDVSAACDTWTDQAQATFGKSDKGAVQSGCVTADSDLSIISAAVLQTQSDGATYDQTGPLAAQVGFTAVIKSDGSCEETAPGSGYCNDDSLGSDPQLLGNNIEVHIDNGDGSSADKGQGTDNGKGGASGDGSKTGNKRRITIVTRAGASDGLPDGRYHTGYGSGTPPRKGQPGHHGKRASMSGLDADADSMAERAEILPDGRKHTGYDAGKAPGNGQPGHHGKRAEIISDGRKHTGYGAKTPDRGNPGHHGKKRAEIISDGRKHTGYGAKTPDRGNPGHHGKKRAEIISDGRKHTGYGAKTPDRGNPGHHGKKRAEIISDGRKHTGYGAGNAPGNGQPGHHGKRAEIIPDWPPTHTGWVAPKPPGHHGKRDEAANLGADTDGKTKREDTPGTGTSGGLPNPLPHNKGTSSAGPPSSGQIGGHGRREEVSGLEAGADSEAKRDAIVPDWPPTHTGWGSGKPPPGHHGNKRDKIIPDWPPTHTGWVAPKPPGHHGKRWSGDKEPGGTSGSETGVGQGPVEEGTPEASKRWAGDTPAPGSQDGASSPDGNLAHCTPGQDCPFPRATGDYKPDDDNGQGEYGGAPRHGEREEGAAENIERDNMNPTQGVPRKSNQPGGPGRREAKTAASNNDCGGGGFDGSSCPVPKYPGHHGKREEGAASNVPRGHADPDPSSADPGAKDDDDPYHRMPPHKRGMLTNGASGGKSKQDPVHKAAPDHGKRGMVVKRIQSVPNKPKGSPEGPVIW